MMPAEIRTTIRTVGVGVDVASALLHAAMRGAISDLCPLSRVADNASAALGYIRADCRTLVALLAAIDPDQADLTAVHLRADELESLVMDLAVAEVNIRQVDARRMYASRDTLADKLAELTHRARQIARALAAFEWPVAAPAVELVTA